MAIKCMLESTANVLTIKLIYLNIKNKLTLITYKIRAIKRYKVKNNTKIRVLSGNRVYIPSRLPPTWTPEETETLRSVTPWQLTPRHVHLHPWFLDRHLWFHSPSIPPPILLLVSCLHHGQWLPPWPMWAWWRHHFLCHVHDHLDSDWISLHEPPDWSSMGIQWTHFQNRRYLPRPPYHPSRENGIPRCYNHD